MTNPCRELENPDTPVDLNCLRCNYRMVMRQATLDGTVHGEQFAVTMERALVCPVCGLKTLEGRQLAEYGRRLSDQYRKAHDLLTSDQIRHRRTEWAMNHEEFAALLHVSEVDVRNWEWSKVQSREEDQMMRRRLW